MGDRNAAQRVGDHGRGIVDELLHRSLLAGTTYYLTTYADLVHW
jgi:hypothetical protein